MKSINYQILSERWFGPNFKKMILHGMLEKCSPNWLQLGFTDHNHKKVRWRFMNMWRLKDRGESPNMLKLVFVAMN